MKSHYIRELLSKSALEQVHQLLKQGEWSKSPEKLVEYYPGYQTSSEMPPSIIRSQISQIVMDAINQDQGFYDLVFPANSTAVIVSNTAESEGIKIHHDNASVGEFSTTVFLTDPDTYEGGELTLWYEGNPQKVKLPAGHAITYETGAPHGVMPVVSGQRYAAVFWTSSSIRDPRHRELLSGMRRIRRLLPVIQSYDYTELDLDPGFQLLGLENKFLRYFINPQ